MKKIAAMVAGVAFTFAAASVGVPPQAQGKDKASLIEERRMKAVVNDSANPLGAQGKVVKPVVEQAGRFAPPNPNFIDKDKPFPTDTPMSEPKKKIPGPTLKEEIAHCANTTLWKDGDCVSKSGNYIVGTDRADIAMGGELSCGIKLKRVPNPPHPEYIPLADAELAPWLDVKDCFRMEFFPTWPNPTRGLNGNQRGFWYTRCYGFGKCKP